MRGNVWKFGLAIAACGLIAPLQASDIVLTRAELDARLAGVPVRAEKSAAERMQSLRGHVSAPLGDPRTEYVIREDLLALELPLDPEARAIVQALAERPPNIFVWHEEGGHARVAETELDVAAAARWVLRQSDIRAAANALQEKTLSPLAGKPEMLAEAARHLAASAPIDELPAHLPVLEAAFRDGAPLEDALMIAAIRGNDLSLALRVIRNGNAERLRRHLKPLHENFAASRREVLQVAMQSPLASHALALVGEHIHEDWAWQELLRALDDSRFGATAALAIARHADNAKLAALAQKLGEESIAASRAALALQLNNSSYALQLLEEFRQHAPDSALAMRIRSWSHD